MNLFDIFCMVTCDCSSRRCHLKGWKQNVTKPDECLTLDSDSPTQCYAQAIEFTFPLALMVLADLRRL